MNLWHSLSSRFRALFQRRSFEADMAAEMADHLERTTAANIAAGMSPEEARFAARRQFGGIDQLKETAREQRTMSWEYVWRDLRFAARSLRKAPTFTAVCVATLAIGIGANLTIFTALDATVLRPLRYPQSERLVSLYEVFENGSLNSVSGGAFLDWREHSQSFEGITLWAPFSANLRSANGAVALKGIEITHEFTRVFGIEPLLGRGFLPEEEVSAETARVIILTEELWRSRFGSDQSVLGSTVVVDDVPRVVVGVLPKRAWFWRDTRFFVPAVLAPKTDRRARASHWAAVEGRLKPGVSPEQADTELKAVRARLTPVYPAWKKDWSVAVRTLQSQLARSPRPVLLGLSAAVALLLLIACVNVANLLLARANDRSPEIALRAALGASGGQLMRHIVSESLLLSAAGGGLGVLLAYGGVAVLREAAGHLLVNDVMLELDWRVLLAAVGLSVTAGVGSALFPAWRVRRPDIYGLLKNGGRSTSRGKSRVQSALVVSEMALTLILLIGAGLMLRSLWQAARIDPGFSQGEVLTFNVSLPSATYPKAADRMAFSKELLARLRAIPGVIDAGLARGLPFSGGTFGEYMSRVDDKDARDRVLARLNFVSDGYFETLGARLMGGRFIKASDNELGAPQVAVINDIAARRFFPQGDALGKRMRIESRFYEIVGIVTTIVDRSLEAEAEATGYVPLAINPFKFSVAIRSSLPVESILGAVRAEVERLNPGVPLADVQSLKQATETSLKGRRLFRNLVAAFAITAAVLACVGIYGVVSYAVATRRRELSVRLALGASPGGIVQLILGQGLRLALLGVGIGVLAALAGARLIASQLYGVSAYDSPVFIGASVALVTVAIGACWFPAKRAANSNPVDALRSE
jgi:predicted permease